jgi:hypothetical protein
MQGKFMLVHRCDVILQPIAFCSEIAESILTVARSGCEYVFMQGVSKEALQWYSQCCCMASVTKTFTLKGVQTIHISATKVHYPLSCLLF